MSYVLHIMPMPAHIDTIDGVYAEWERLNQRPRRTEPNSTFGEVGYYLRLRYPVDPNNPEFSPWLEGPPRGDTLEHVWALGFNTSAIQASRAFSELVDIANTLDLAVVDDQTASAWLPGGRELLGPQLQQQPASQIRRSEPRSDSDACCL
ncbi:MAG: hypothetical protein Q4G39_05640 [Brachymonas sp.]|nr:hypothetical protein [Brachymonas sp.]